MQVGYEIFDRTDVIQSDADAFCRIKNALSDLPLRVATGDIGILMAAVSGLKTTERRKNLCCAIYGAHKDLKLF